MARRRSVSLGWDGAQPSRSVEGDSPSVCANAGRLLLAHRAGVIYRRESWAAVGWCYAGGEPTRSSGNGARGDTGSGSGDNSTSTARSSSDGACWSGKVARGTFEWDKDGRRRLSVVLWTPRRLNEAKQRVAFAREPTRRINKRGAARALGSCSSARERRINLRCRAPPSGSRPLAASTVYARFTVHIDHRTTLYFECIARPRLATRVGMDLAGIDTPRSSRSSRGGGGYSRTPLFRDSIDENFNDVIIFLSIFVCFLFFCTFFF